MPDFRRGAEAMAKAKESAKSGSFRPFAPALFWKGDQDNKYLLFLNDINSIPTVEMVSFIPVKGKKGDGGTFTYYEQVIARTDPAIGEAKDPLVDEWDAKPRETCVAVAVELEPLFETVKGRQRPRGFEVKTTTFDRRVRDDEGELTNETEEVEAPVIGFITQSPHNFFNVVSSYDANEAPIEETPVKITRVGGDNSTVYTVDGYPDQEIDLGGLIECVDGISYLGDDLDDLVDQISDLEDAEAAQVIGAFLLDKRLEELADPDRYDDLFDGVTESLDKFGSKKKKSKDKDSSKRERPARRSQRRSRSEEAAESAEEPEVEAEAEEPAEEEKPKRRSRTRKAAEEPEAEAESGGDEPEEAPKPKRSAARGKQADPKAMSKLEELRQRSAERKAKATA
jgi:hypothetical protein